MNSDAGTWYNELYRLMADDQLLTQEQTVRLGQCLRAIQAGENAEYHLNELYYSVKNNKELAERLEEFMHSYIKNRNEDHAPEPEEENPTFSSYQFIGSWT